MIRKFLLIANNGCLLYYLNDDGIKIQQDLLSGFSKALYDISIELTFPLQNVGFENNKMIVEDIKHTEDITLLLAMIYDEYHIDEGIKKKIHHIYKKFFKMEDFTDTSIIRNEEKLDQVISGVIKDDPLRALIMNNLEVVKQILDPILLKKENEIHAYSIHTSNNQMIYCNGTYQLLKFRESESVEDVIKEYLLLIKQEKIPHGDKFIGLDFPEGLDLTDYINTGQKTLGVVINTSINLKEEPNNELLLYFYGKNTLIRSCVLDIEHTLRYKLTEI